MLESLDLASNGVSQSALMHSHIDLTSVSMSCAGAAPTCSQITCSVPFCATGGSLFRELLRLAKACFPKERRHKITVQPILSPAVGGVRRGAACDAVLEAADAGVDEAVQRRRRCHPAGQEGYVRRQPALQPRQDGVARLAPEDRHQRRRLQVHLRQGKMKRIDARGLDVKLCSSLTLLLITGYPAAEQEQDKPLNPRLATKRRIDAARCEAVVREDMQG